jgi:branched-chain amino acid transport system ATP-binding protein
LSLVVKDLSTSYDNLRVLWDVDLKVDRGEIVCLIGSNGAGKSTVVKSIIGLVTSKSGSIVFEGNDLSRVSIHDRVRRGLGYVPEGRRLFYSMTVLENLLMGSRRHTREQLDLVHNLFPILRERSSQFAGNLSGGEQQMLAIGRALMSQPKLLILDELSAGLAPIMFERVLESILTINERGVSVFLAEQNSERALEISHRGYVLQNGRVVLNGDSHDLANSQLVQQAYLGT